MNEKTYEAILPRVRSALLGLAVADALGVPVEFCSRRELELDPVLDMRGFGTYGMPAGSGTFLLRQESTQRRRLKGRFDPIAPP